MTYVPFRTDGRLICVKKKKNGVIKSIKGKKKEDGASEKKLRMKRKPTTLKKGKINRQQQQQKIQKHTQNVEYNAYHVCNCASTNFQCL